MYEKVRKMLALQLRTDEEHIKPDSLIMEELGADSIDILQLLMNMEEELGFTIPDEALAGFRTVSDIVNYIEKLQNEQK